MHMYEFMCEFSAMNNIVKSWLNFAATAMPSLSILTLPLGYTTLRFTGTARLSLTSSRPPQPDL